MFASCEYCCYESNDCDSEFDLSEELRSDGGKWNDEDDNECPTCKRIGALTIRWE